MELRCGKDHKLLAIVFPDRIEIKCKDHNCGLTNVFYFDKEVTIVKQTMVKEVRKFVRGS